MRKVLKFKNRSLERLYIDDYDRKAIHNMRVGYWLAVILFALFGILDYFLMPLSYLKMWFIRFAVVIPAATVSYILTYVNSCKMYLQAFLSFSAMVMGFGIIAMMAIAQKTEPGHMYYYAGLMLVIMGICSLFRLRFYYALVTTLTVTAGYELVAVFVQGINSGARSITLQTFINNNFFFIGADLIGLMAAYYFEHFSRVDFIQQIEIGERHRDIIRLLDNMKTELELAKQIQARLLPDSCPYIVNARVASLYKPMEELGGDFYDFTRFEGSSLTGFFISDVSGHGLPAALITSMLKILGSTSGNARLTADGFLKYINIHLTGQIGENFLTAIYAIYDPGTRILRYSRAGHPYPLLVRNGEVKQLVSGGGIIGIDSFAVFEESSVQLQPGDRVLFYTDGLVEEVDGSRRSFEDLFFGKVLPSLAGMSIEDIINISYRRLIDFKGDESFADDICVLGLEITG